mgnify:CR=1 FL=1
MFSDVDLAAEEVSGETLLLSGRSSKKADKKKQKKINDARKAWDHFVVARGSADKNVKDIDWEEQHVRNLFAACGYTLSQEFDDRIKFAAKEWNRRCFDAKLKALRTVTICTKLSDLTCIKMEEACFLDPIEDFGVKMSPKAANKLKVVAREYNNALLFDEVNDNEATKKYINDYRFNILKGERQLFDQLAAAGIKMTPELQSEITAINELLKNLNKKAIKATNPDASETILPGKRNNAWKYGRAGIKVAP